MGGGSLSGEIGNVIEFFSEVDLEGKGGERFWFRVRCLVRRFY